MSANTFQAAPAPETCKLIDFEECQVVPGIVNNTFFLIVRGTKPCINMQVSLVPMIYVQCPEYWRIEVVGCLPNGICLPAIGTYEETISLTGITGSKGKPLGNLTSTDSLACFVWGPVLT